MSRPSDWSAVGLSRDPVPGDPVVVRQGGVDYRSTASAMRRAAATLRGLQAGVEKSETVAGLLANRDKIESQVTVAEARYQAAGDALVDYAVVLDQTQGATARALSEAKIAVSDEAEASRLAGLYQRLANSETAPEQASTRSYHLRLAGSYRSDASTARTKLANQKDIITQAQADRDTAARQAIDKITTATSSDGLKDSWWDDWGAKLVKFIAKLAEAIAAIAGILALLLCWVPGLGQALLAIAAIAGVVAALANIALAATGEVSWGEAIVSIIFAALGCVGLGGARGILTALKGGAKLAKGAASALKGKAGEALATGMMNLLKRTFKGWKGLQAVGRAGERAAGIAKNTIRIKPTGFRKFRIPDGLVPGFLHEVKNVQYLELAGRIKSQFSAFAKYASSRTPPITFVLHVRTNTTIGPAMAEFIRVNGVEVRLLDNWRLLREGAKEFFSLAGRAIG